MVTRLPGDGPGEMGDSLHAIELGENRTVVHITAGDYHQLCYLWTMGHTSVRGITITLGSVMLTP